MSGAVQAAPGRELTRAQLIWTGIVLWLCFLIVGGAAAFSSFSHIVHVSQMWGQNEVVSLVMPFAIDGSMVIATVAHFRDRMTGRRPRTWGKVMLWGGVIASIGANAGSLIEARGFDIYAPNSWAAVIWAALPPLLLMGDIEVMSKPGRVIETAELVARTAEKMRATVTELTHGHSSKTATGEPATAGNGNGHAPAAGPEPVNVPAQTSPLRSSRPQDDEPLPERLVTLARQVGAQFKQRTGRDITRIQLREDLARAGWTKGISNVTATRLLALLRNSDGEDQDQSQGEPVPAVARANGHA